MSDKKSCTCPICNGQFSPALNMGAAEHLARGIIMSYGEKQQQAERDDFVDTCPRCGEKMLPGVRRNALSRHFDVFICPSCGNDEALRVFSHDTLPPEDWWITEQILEATDKFNTIA